MRWKRLKITDLEVARILKAMNAYYSQLPSLSWTSQALQGLRYLELLYTNYAF